MTLFKRRSWRRILRNVARVFWQPLPDHASINAMWWGEIW